jgi:hypothetical protein
MLEEEVLGEVGRFVERVWKPREDLGFRAWCEGNIILRESESPDYAGNYSGEMVVPVVRLFESFLDDPQMRLLVLSKCSQSSASSHALFEIVRRVERGVPGNIVYVIHSAEEARNIGHRLDALLADCVGASDIVDEVPADDKSTLVKRLPGKTIWLTGAGSAGALASKPGVSLVVVDEVDKHKLLKGEAETIELASQRGKTVGDRKVIAFSTPTTEDGQIWRGYLDGSQMEYRVPCPCCTEMIALEVSMLRWGHCKDLAGEYDLHKVLDETLVECSRCGEKFNDDTKRQMVDDGDWCATNFYEDGAELELNDGEGEPVELGQRPRWQPGVMSARLGDMVSFWPGSGWGDLAVERIKTGSDPLKVHGFLNNREGKPFKQGAMASVELRHVERLCGSYKRGTVPIEPELVLFAADTQDSAWKWAMGCVDKNGDLYVSDYGVNLSWREIIERARDGVKFDGADYQSNFCGVDEGGHRAREVRKNVLPLAPWFVPMKGLGGMQVRKVIDWRSHQVDPDLVPGMGQRIDTVECLTFDDDAFKRELYRDRILSGRKLPDGISGRNIWFPTDMDESFARELCAEQLVKGENPKTGKVGWYWKVKGANDFGDAVKMLLILYAATR